MALRTITAVVALGVAVSATAGFAQDASAALRASGAVGEQSDGYLGVVGDASASIREQVSAINIKRRAFYTDIARNRGATVQEVAVKTACELFQNKVQAGQSYMLPDGVWRKSTGTIALPSYCG